MEYNGWKQIDKIKIVYSNASYTEVNGVKYPKAYIVDSNNAKSLESAIKWATYYKKDNPVIEETDNIDFDFSLAEAASESYQGGKLSFWMCIISKKGITPFAVGINSDLLLSLLLKSTFTNGKCNKKVLFARKNGQLGVLHTEMSDYKDLLNDMKVKSNMSKGKTTKWKIGYEYKTLTQSDVLLGYFTPIVNIEYDRNSYDFRCKQTLTVNFDTEEYPIIHYNPKDSLEACVKHSFTFIGPRFYDKVKLPARQEGNKIFDSSTINDDISKIIISYFKDNHDLNCRLISSYISTAFSIYRINPAATIEILEILKQHIIEDTKDILAEKYPSRFNDGQYNKIINKYDSHERFTKMNKEFLVTKSCNIEIKIKDKIKCVTSYEQLIDYFIELAKCN